MKIIRVIAFYFVMLLILIMCLGLGPSYSELPQDIPDNEVKIDPSIFEAPSEYFEFTVVAEPLDCFEYAEIVTGFSAEILRGIAATESRFKTKAVGDEGMSFGMFQLHSRWYESRVEKWGEFDPADPFESAVIAGLIMQENLTAFNGDLRLAVAAYKQGVMGVLKRGVIQGYVDDVLSWRNDPEKMLSFSLFCGITDIEGLQDGYKSAGTQDTYKFNDSLAVQVSWRGSSGFSY
jgi:hypothetical protein